jgi:hypothetical protein
MVPALSCRSNPAIRFLSGLRSYKPEKGFQRDNTQERANQFLFMAPSPEPETQISAQLALLRIMHR